MSDYGILLEALEEEGINVDVLFEAFLDDLMEEIEEINEISDETKKSYVKGALANINKLDDRASKLYSNYIATFLKAGKMDRNRWKNDDNPKFDHANSKLKQANLRTQANAYKKSKVDPLVNKVNKRFETLRKLEDEGISTEADARKAQLSQKIRNRLSTISYKK